MPFLEITHCKKCKSPRKRQHVAFEYRSLCHTAVCKVMNMCKANLSVEGSLERKPVLVAHFKYITALPLCGLKIIHEGTDE